MQFLNSVIIKSFCVVYALSKQPCGEKNAAICEKRRLFGNAFDIESNLCFISRRIFSCIFFGCTFKYAAVDEKLQHAVLSHTNP